MTDIGLMVRSANPVPDETQALTDDELSTVLLLAQQRSGDMDTKEAVTPVASETPRHRGWIVAGAAFAAVIVVIAATIALSRSADEVTPATTPPTTEAAPSSTVPTTTAIPSATQADVTAVLSAWNAGTEEAVRGTLAEGARVDDSVLNEIIFWTLAGQQWIVADCTTDATPTIQCTTENPNPLYEAVGYQPWVWELSVRVEGGSVTSLSASPALNRPDLSDDFAEAWFAYREWLLENHPEAAAAIAFPLEPDMAGPFTEHLVEFVAASPSGEAAADAVVEALVTALNEGDAEAVRQIFDAAGSVVSSDTADDDDRARESGRWATWALLDSSAEVVGCAVLSSGPTRCELTRTSAFDATSDNPQTLVLQIRASSDGEVDLLRIDLGAGLWVDVETEFGVWVRESQPADYIPMFVDFSDPERTADLWRALYPAWAAGDE